LELYRADGRPCVLIEDADGLTIVDTGLKLAGPKILKQIAERGKKPADIKRILITHAHPDHVGGLPFLKRETGAQVISSALEQPVIEGKVKIPRPTHSRIKMPNQTLECVPVDRTVSDGEVLNDILGGLQVVFTPGHAPGHISFWHPQKRFMIAGDTIFHVFGLRPSPGFITVDQEENKRSIRKIVDMEPSVICFGHGDPIKENTAQTLREFAAKL
jgi:glyoxylase-like metal-dependent hydrolase (beta-lactamase superfamily II)